MFGSFDIVIFGILALCVLVLFARRLIELYRRWFVKVEYPCPACGSRFTTLHGKYLGIETGSFYRTHCLRCKHVSSRGNPYYFGKGKWVGEKRIGWRRKSLAASIAENQAVAERIKKQA